MEGWAGVRFLSCGRGLGVSVFSCAAGVEVRLLSCGSGAGVRFLSSAGGVEVRFLSCGKGCRGEVFARRAVQGQVEERFARSARRQAIPMAMWIYR